MFSYRPISPSLNLTVCNMAAFIPLHLILAHRFCSRRRHGLRATICRAVRCFSMLHVLSSPDCLESYVPCSRFAWNADGPFRPKQLSTCARWSRKGCSSLYLRDLYIAFTFLLARWASMTPLRQFKGVPAEVTRKAEGKQFVSYDLVCWNISWCPQQPWARYFDLVSFALFCFCYTG
jgi:hypothetical protein